MSDFPHVTAVLLSYNRPEMLGEALSSVVAQTYPNLRVLVVDNRSPASDAIADLVARFPTVELIAQPTNAGFTGGMNKGLEHASGDYIYLTEDDIILAPDYLESLVAYIVDRPQVGIASGVQYNNSDSTFRFAGGEFTLGRVFELIIHRECQQDSGGSPDPFPTGFVPGSMMLARADIWRRLGGFRDDFFMYCEDLELCARVRRLGLCIMVVPTAKAYHFDPPQEPVSVTISAHGVKNLAALYLLHASPGVLPEFFLRYALIAPLKALVRDRRMFVAQLLGWLAFSRGFFTLLRARVHQRPNDVPRNPPPTTRRLVAPRPLD
jgi:GT2 family glycosyltransferase